MGAAGSDAVPNIHVGAALARGQKGEQFINLRFLFGKPILGGPRLRQDNGDLLSQAFEVLPFGLAIPRKTPNTSNMNSIQMAAQFCSFSDCDKRRSIIVQLRTGLGQYAATCRKRSNDSPSTSPDVPAVRNRTA
jgi:hypothetical protein